MKKIFFVIFLIFLSFNIAKADYINNLEIKLNDVDFSISTDDKLIDYIAVVTQSDNTPKIPDEILNSPELMIINKDIYYFKGNKNQSFKIENIKKSSKYYIYLFSNKNTNYQFVEKSSFCTLSNQKPENPKGIAFKYLGDNKYQFMFNAMNGDGFIIVASPNKISNKPKPGKKYNAAPFGSKIANYEGGSETVIYNSEGSSKNKALELTINSPEKFYMAVFSYVGSDECVNYDGEIGKNMRLIIPGLDPPVAIDSRSFPGGFLARWKTVAGAENYLIDVATDSKFRNIIEGYNGIDFGNISEVPIIIDNAEISEVYYRIRAAGNGKMSANSNVVTVRLR